MNYDGICYNFVPSRSQECVSIAAGVIANDAIVIAIINVAVAILFLVDSSTLAEICEKWSSENFLIHAWFLLKVSETVAVIVAMVMTLILMMMMMPWGP
jgi:hypothetical protein